MKKLLKCFKFDFKFNILNIDSKTLKTTGIIILKIANYFDDHVFIFNFKNRGIFI